MHHLQEYLNKKRIESARIGSNLILYAKLAIIWQFYGVYMHNYIVDDGSDKQGVL